MDIILSQPAVRVLGCLIEKQITTPDYYPLTLNSLTTACNQKSNRDPVVAYDDDTVVAALNELRDHRLIWQTSTAGSRVSKYEHGFRDVFDVDAAETAALCVLMLRGPQTIGEIRGRTGRLYDFADLAEVEAALDSLAGREGGAMVQQLPRQPGRKESRFTQLLAGEPEVVEVEHAAPVEPARARVEARDQRIAELEGQVAELRAELQALRAEFDTFRHEFD
jgi:uncharacterized protein YceH (UPF0502 family)